MTCAHHFKPYAPVPFQALHGAAWVAEYCHCGAVRHHLINPNAGKPIAEDQSNLDIATRDTIMEWLRQLSTSSKALVTKANYTRRA